jgi:iron complex outermembrane receptor protein
MGNVDSEACNPAASVQAAGFLTTIIFTRIQMVTMTFYRRPLALKAVLLASCLCAPHHARAQTVGTNLDLGAVTATGGDGGTTSTLATTPGTATYEALSRTPISSGQPTEVISRQAIANTTSPTESYDQLIALTPSVQDIQPNGPVAQQNYGESIRGFQYSQFNTLLDGIVIPGTPQTAVYFTNHDIGTVDVDRGPGTASTIGYATFGGTVAVNTKDPSPVAEVNPYVTAGSFESRLYGLDLETGAQKSANGGAGFIDLSDTATGAALSGTTTERKNVFLKWVQPIGQNTVVTAVAIINRSYGHTPYGTTLAEIQKYGDGYALTSNPGSQDFTGDNDDTYNTDFEYVRVASQLSDELKLTDTAYTNAYDHFGFQGADPNGTTCNINVSTGTGCTPAVKAYINGKLAPAGDVPGLQGQSDFRDFGNILKLTRATSFGAIESGLWIDYYTQSAFKFNADLSQGGTPFTTTATGQPFTYLYHDSFTTLQPYLQADINITSQLELLAGSKYTSESRGLNAPINKSTLLPEIYHIRYTDFEPSAELKYRFSEQFSAYAQVAKGYLAPPLGDLNTKIPVNVAPQTTYNYQVGTSYQAAAWSASFDAYDIPFQNYIASQKVSSGTLYFNAGGATFAGLEAEATKTLPYSFNLYANGSLNDATYSNGAQVAQSPRRTGAAGVTYDHFGLWQSKDHLFASVIGKYVGPQYGQYKLSSGSGIDSFPLKSYSDTTAALDYSFFIQPKKSLTVSLDVDNLFNRTGIEGLAGVAGDGVTPLYWTQPGRSYFITISGHFS